MKEKRIHEKGKYEMFFEGKETPEIAITRLIPDKKYAKKNKSRTRDLIVTKMTKDEVEYKTKIVRAKKQKKSRV